jgi:hypothetical protein
MLHLLQIRWHSAGMPEMRREYVSTERFIPNGMKKTNFGIHLLHLIYFASLKMLHYRITDKILCIFYNFTVKNRD